ncbi:ABC transporter [Cryptosporidium parvum]|uniref:Putative ABC transporter protein, possible n=2 Tax=Cryptosporidium parvum TaxID=5807 RepID=A0A7G2HIZ1_CRYPV|nr:ABC transporter [Cryptosporidium parvum]WKS78661.1 ABC transporter [Cryptosporidium sp. 43IA8]WRK33151.1 ABC transporter [Cryptosporidium parvum]CAD98355.1 putative ABC transporter protein, possible [Cryptosporidium parvum]|eukprot:QOY41430.1 hypothetical protein CPATCC_003138 [Cryptosporidium parvum]
MHTDKIESKPVRGSIFPPNADQGVYLAATDISYQITSGVFEQSTARILSGIKFFAEPKTMTAILGPSGSGKTSLLNILSGRLSSTGNKLVGGSIYLNGKKVTSKDLKSRCSYVMQHEMTIPYLTIEETLLYSAELRLPFLSAKERREKVRILLNDLGLVHCMHSIVGDDKVRSISGGERKRVILGTELISDPQILFIDEPTSGLDAFMAFQILQLLIKLAKTGRTIICTIHQPRTQVFQAFDEILLLSKGEVIYQGPSKSSVDYFSLIGYPVPENYNPTDYYLDLLVPRSNVEKFADSRLHSITYEQLRVLPELYLSSEYNDRVIRKIDEHLSGQYSPIPELLLFSRSSHTCFGWIRKKLFAFSVIVKRSFMNNARNTLGSLVIGVLVNAFIAVVIGSIFFNLPSFSNDIGITFKNATNIMGALFFSVMIATFGAMIALESFTRFRIIFSRERAKGLYGPATYMLGKHVGDFIFEIVPILVFSHIFYFMSNTNSVSYPGWNTLTQYLCYQLTILLTSWASYGLVYFICGITKSLELAYGIAPLIIIFFVIVSGFYVTVNKLPLWVSWIKYISFQRYSYSALVVNTFPPNQNWGPIQTDILLKQFSIDQTSFLLNAVVLVVLGILYRIFACIAFALFFRNLGLE